MKNKVALAGIIQDPSTSTFSHNAGWTFVIKSIMENYLNTDIDIIKENDNWDKYSIILLSEGVNFKEGSFNFFGGVQQKQINKLEKLYNYKGRVLSLSGKLDYNIVMQKRKELANYDFVFDIPEEINILKSSKKLVLGDSHSISVFKPGFTISRNDGKTLRGFLKKGIKEYISDDINELIFYAGNIDIRFHMFNPNRIGDYKVFCDELLLELEKQLLNLNIPNITCVKLLPIEDESRKLPKTGQLDGLNFYGSMNERLLAVNYFNDKLEKICNRNNFKILNWNFDYSEPLNFQYMEARQSVHLRPSSYMFKDDILC